MKGEILRRMSMETVKVEGVDSNPVQTDVKDKVEEDDYLVKTAGAFGLWQAVVSVALMLNRTIALLNLMSISQLQPDAQFVCVEFLGNVTFEVINSTCYESCLKYDYLIASMNQDFGFICQNSWMTNFRQSVLMIGLLFGAFVFGWISDRFGRRMAMIQSTLLNGVLMIALQYSPSYIIFILIRLMIGIATGGLLFVSVIHIMEIIGKQYREVAGACCSLADGVAEASIAGFAYYTAYWHSYTVSYGVATCFIFVSILYVPESPRWLVAYGKIDEAIEVITSAANRNNLNTSHIKAEITKAVDDLKLNNCVNTSYLDFFTSKALFIRTITIFLMWFALGTCYYGIYQHVTVIGMDPYLSVVVLGLIQVPFCPIGIILNWRFGRRISTIGITITLAVTMFILVFVPKDHCGGPFLGILTFICTNVSYSITFIHVSELYPTSLRAMSFALSSGGARIGALIAPFIATLSPVWLPSLLFCLFPIVAGFCCFTLPETRGQNFKDVIKK